MRTIKSKIQSLILLILLVIVVMGVVSIVLQERTHMWNQVLEVQVEKIIMITELQLAVNETVMPANDYIITGDGSYRERFNRLDETVRKNLERITTSGYFKEDMVTVKEVERLYEGLKGISLDILGRESTDKESPLLMERMDYEYAATAVQKVLSIKSGIDRQIEEAKKNIAEIKRISRIVFAALILVTSAGGVIFGMLITRSVIRPINEVTEVVSEIAQGEGDLTKRLDVRQEDEIGKLGNWFNRFIEGLQDIVSGVNRAAGDLISNTGNLAEASNKIKKSSERQLTAVEETSSSIGEIEATVKSVAASAEKVLEDTDSVSSSILEMSSSVEEIAHSMGKLSGSVDTTSAAVTEIVASIREVSSNVERLFSLSEEIISSITEINASIKQIGELSREQTELSKDVEKRATSAGRDTAQRNMKGMERIREEVASTTTIIARLGERSSQVGSILAVINNVTESTSLLALNAAILAAQAKEQGKGFSVVAEEIKELADQTAGSTKEIADIIKRFKEDIVAAISSIEISSKGVEEGVNYSLAVNESLESILRSTEKSVDMAKKIESATIEQSKGATLVEDSVRKMGTMVEEMKRAIDEQRKGADGILKAAEDMIDVTRMVKSSTLQQAKESKYTSGLVADVAQRMRAVVGALEEERVAMVRLKQNAEMLRDIGEDNVGCASDLDGAVAGVKQQSDYLRKEMGKFKV